MPTTTICTQTSLLKLSSPSHYHHSPPLLRWGLKRYDAGSSLTSRTRGRAFQVLANPNVSSGKENSDKEVIMVDPVEAKRLADKQMEQIQRRKKQKRSRQIEAINGAWAMIGLTAGLVIEGETGNGIVAQLASYWFAIVHFFGR